MNITPAEQSKAFDELVEEYMSVLRGDIPLKTITVTGNKMEQYSAKYNVPLIVVSRDVHLAAIMTIALQDKK
ncbi:hypothetical protein MCCARTNEY_252 [Bacillus phage vB_BanH_McCartney]|nr:hypothetical protein MCCARTNEY_252 [Bacillus phage vB_BanH_McCartney]